MLPSKQGEEKKLNKSFHKSTTLHEMHLALPAVAAVVAHDAAAEPAVVLAPGQVERLGAVGAEVDDVLRDPRHHRLLVSTPLDRVHRK